MYIEALTPVVVDDQLRANFGETLDRLESSTRQNSFRWPGRGIVGICVRMGDDAPWPLAPLHRIDGIALKPDGVIVVEQHVNIGNEQLGCATRRCGIAEFRPYIVGFDFMRAAGPSVDHQSLLSHFGYLCTDLPEESYNPFRKAWPRELVKGFYACGHVFRDELLAAAVEKNDLIP